MIKHFCNDCSKEISDDTGMVNFGAQKQYCKPCYEKTWPTCTECGAITEHRWGCGKGNRLCGKCMFKTPAGKKWKKMLLKAEGEYIRGFVNEEEKRC